MSEQIKLKRMTEEERAKNNFKSIEESVAQDKRGCKRLIVFAINIMVLSVLFIIIGIGIVSINENTSKDNILLGVCTIIAVVYTIFTIYLFRKKPKLNIHTAFKKLENRYNDLENNLKEMNKQMHEPETYVVRTGLYLTKDWIVSLDLYCLDYAKIEDVIGVFGDKNITETPTSVPGSKIRSTANFLMVLLKSEEILQFEVLSEENIQEAIKVIEQKNPYIFKEGKVVLDDGRKIDLYKHKSQAIEEYNKRKMSSN